MKLFNHYNHKGFTLIETLFAILIFSASLVSLMAIAGRGIAAAHSAREQTTAHYLAQEGLEVVRNIRDTNMINQQSWDTQFDSCTETAPCQIDYQAGSDIPVLVPCTTDPVKGCQMGESNNAFVNEGSGQTPSGYFRKIYSVPGDIDTLTGLSREYKIVSIIKWNAKGIDRSVVMQMILKKWQ